MKNGASAGRGAETATKHAGRQGGHAASEPTTANPLGGGHTPRRCFITGYPGFISRFLIRQILVDDPDATVVALCQPSLLDAARKFRASLPERKQRQVDIVSGDILNMHLGLSSAEYVDLTRGVTDVFHLAALNSLSVDHATMQRVNVDGTRNVIELARDCGKLERFNYFSSVFISGSRQGVITEDEFVQPPSFRNAFEETKFQAERFVRRHMHELPTTIYRPSIVIGDSQSGEVDRFQGPYYFIVALLTSPRQFPIPLPGDGAGPLNMVPVDYVVRATSALSTNPDTVGKTFHLVDPNPLSARRVYELIAQRAGRRVPRFHVSATLTKALLKLPFLEKKMRSPLAAIEYFNHMAVYNCSNSLRYLEGTGVMCPPFESYVDTLFAYAREQLMHGTDHEEGDPLEVASYRGEAQAG